MKHITYYIIAISATLLLAVIAVPFFFDVSITPKWRVEKGSEQHIEQIAAQVFPKNGVEIPIEWGDFGAQLIELGVIDKEKFESVYRNRGGLSPQDKALFSSNYDDGVIIDEENAQVWLNILWAFGLANKNEILEQGPMVDNRYGGAGRFASTGGWTLARGDAMDHYSAHPLVNLTTEQQSRVERVAKGIYRPCCGNSTYFPDCNHGMAMLGLLELMASEGMSESEMYDVALRVNSYWFPDTYLTIAQYIDEQGESWADVDAKTVLGTEYSSAQGYSNIKEQVNPTTSQGGASCGV